MTKVAGANLVPSKKARPPNMVSTKTVLMRTHVVSPVLIHGLSKGLPATFDMVGRIAHFGLKAGPALARATLRPSRPKKYSLFYPSFSISCRDDTNHPFFSEKSPTISYEWVSIPLLKPKTTVGIFFRGMCDFSIPA